LLKIDPELRFKPVGSGVPAERLKFTFFSDGGALPGRRHAVFALNGWIWVNLHKVIQAFQTVRISSGADHEIFSPASSFLGLISAA